MDDLNQWIECEKELPSEDGYFEVRNETQIHSVIMEYDGYGFKFNNIYHQPDFWRKLKERNKRYGKQ